jgi:hypothetical protein
MLANDGPVIMTTKKFQTQLLARFKPCQLTKSTMRHAIHTVDNAFAGPLMRKPTISAGCVHHLFAPILIA